MNILLCCSQGLSSSLLCSKMKKYVANEGRDDKVWAVGLDLGKDEIKKADFLLLGPHMRASAKSLVEDAEKLGVPYMTIDRMDYAYGNAKAVFAKIKAHLEESEEH